MPDADPSAASGPDAPSSVQVTALLAAAGRGDREASDELLTLVYAQLRALAQKRMNSENAGHTLQATALVHEAYVRLLDGGVAWNDRAHFFRSAAEAMRRILVDHARAKRAGVEAGKPVGGSARRPLQMPGNVLDLAADADPDAILALDDALARLSRVDEEAAMVVRLRFFAGRTVDETAMALGISPRQVDREWAFARAWLAHALREAGEVPD